MKMYPECQPQTIDDFLAGQLADQPLSEFEHHLGECWKCESELRHRTADDDFWNDTRRFLKSSDSTQDDHHQPEQASVLSLLDPTDDPNSMGRLAGYEVVGVVGIGGMGIVLKARDVSLDRLIAIKLLHPSYAGHSAPRQRFAREAQAAATVVHDNVIAIHGVSQWKEIPFLVMPYIKGESLQHRIDGDAPLPVDDILRVGIQVARGLAAAHDQGLIHRDVKPANVLMPSGVSRVILTDFGLARAANDASLTRSGVLAGTPPFMSPEQARGESLDARTDLFSLGSVLYAMACGRPPFRSDTAYAVLRKITDDSHRPVIELRSDIPLWLSQIIDRLLEKNPDDRFQSADELADHLEHCLAHRQQPTTTLLPKLKNQRPRFPFNGVRWSVMALALVGCLAIFAWSMIPNDASHPLVPRGPSPSTPFSAEVWSFDDSDLSSLELSLSEMAEETNATVSSSVP